MGKNIFSKTNYIQRMDEKNETVNKLSDAVPFNFTNECKIEDAFDQFIQFKKANNLAERTLSDHKIHFRYFIKYLYKNKPNIKQVKDLKLEDILDYKSFMTAKKVWDDHPSLFKERSHETISPSTINTRIRTLNCLLKFWFENKFLDKKLSIKLIPKKDEVLNAPTEAEINRIVAQFDPKRLENYYDLRNYVIILLLIDTGLRISELLSITTECVNMVQREINLTPYNAKSRREHTVYFKNKTALHLEILLQNNKEYGFHDDCIFLSLKGVQLSDGAFRKALGLYIKDTKLESNITPHKFRDYFATTFINNGGQVPKLQKLLDHKDITTTVKYLKFSNEDIKSAYHKFSPQSI